MIDLRLGDCLEVLPTLAAGSADCCVTDPPYGLQFMGCTWDHGVPGIPYWEAVHRVLKPGAVLLAFGGTRTYHRMACAVEDAGFAVEDSIQWIYAQGFPKHKSKLKPAHEPIVLARKPGPKWLGVDAGRVEAAESWHRPCRKANAIYGGGSGTNLTTSESNPAGRYPPNLCFSHHPDCQPCGTKKVKPACHGGGKDTIKRQSLENWRFQNRVRKAITGPDGLEEVAAWACVEGCPVAALDEQAGERRTHPGCYRNDGTAGLYGPRRRAGDVVSKGGAESHASRFYPTFAWGSDDLPPFRYCPKAPRSERGEGNDHPCLKPLALTRWLCRLACPPGGTVLDPFLGSGTTALAALAEGFGCVGIERNPEYLDIARARLDAARAALPLFA